jgi:hypothetical protein
VSTWAPKGEAGVEMIFPVSSIIQKRILPSGLS